MGWEVLLSGTLGALIVLGLQILRDSRKQKYERRLYILRTLMANFSNVVSFDFVSAFNIILIEYHQKSEVRKWHTKFMEHVSNPGAKDDDEAKIRNNTFNNILVKLIEEIAKSVNIKIEQIDIANKIYWPKGFGEQNATQQRLVQILIETQEQWKNMLKKIKDSDFKLEVKQIKKKKKD